jgi:hypothetical protein
MVFMIESQIAYILDSLHWMARRELQTIEVRSEVQAAFNAELQRRMQGTVWSSGCSSWYLDASRHNTSLWPGFTWEFRRRTRHFDSQSFYLVPRKATHQTPLGMARGQRSRERG